MFSCKTHPPLLFVLLITIYTPMLFAQRVEQSPYREIETPFKQSDSASVNAIELISLINSDTDSLALKKVSNRLSDVNSLTTSMNLSVQFRNSNAITVKPSTRIRYMVVGVLSDDNNQGLALMGFNLVFDGGDLQQAFEPTGEPTPGCDNPMINFVVPWGITNPAGFGGTIIDGDLVQVGGGQNTINNTPDNADFPIGPVLLGVAQPSGCGPVVFARGDLQVPDIEGVYTLYITEFFANVIQYDTDGDPYWATEAVQIGTLTPLTITVSLLDDTDTTRNKLVTKNTRK